MLISNSCKKNVFKPTNIFYPALSYVAFPRKKNAKKHNEKNKDANTRKYNQRKASTGDEG